VGRVTTVVLGANHFVDCGALVAFGSEPVLQIARSPLRLTLVTPANLPSGRTVRVIDNVPAPASADHVRVVATDRSVAVFWDEAVVAILTDLGGDKLSVHVDLRSLGINLYDDAKGLHVGNMHFRGSTFVGTEGPVFQLG